MGLCGWNTACGGQQETKKWFLKPGCGGCGPQPGVCAPFCGPWGAIANVLAPEEKSFRGSPGVHLIGRYEPGGTHGRYHPPSRNLICLAQCYIFSARNYIWSIVGTQQWC